MYSVFNSASVVANVEKDKLRIKKIARTDFLGVFFHCKLFVQRCYYTLYFSQIPTQLLLSKTRLDYNSVRR